MQAQRPALLACINQTNYAAFPNLNLKLLENNLKETLKVPQFHFMLLNYSVDFSFSLFFASCSNTFNLTNSIL